jgi:DNA-binding NarL/FixJ family response regulator
MATLDKTYKVFVVEDSDVYRSVVRAILEEEDKELEPEIALEVHDFSSGEECLRNIHLNPDILILDYALDSGGKDIHMNGYELLQEIHRKDMKPEVIVLSCEENMKVVKSFLREGISEFIRKEGIEHKRIKSAIKELVLEKEVRKRRIRNIMVLGTYLSPGWITCIPYS